MGSRIVILQPKPLALPSIPPYFKIIRKLEKASRDSHYKGVTMLPRADLGVYDRHSQLVAIIEIKKKMGTSRSWAIQYRRNILAHGMFHMARFFLLALPDRFFLWETREDQTELDEPAYEIDSRSILDPYVARIGASFDTMSGPSFEMIVSAWLGDLLRVECLSDNLKQEHSWLTDSGFFEAIRGGRIAAQVAV